MCAFAKMLPDPGTGSQQDGEEVEGECDAGNDANYHTVEGGRRYSSYLWVKTATLYLSYIGMGLVVGGYGPTVVNLVTLLDTDLKSLGAAMVGGSIGYVSGSAIGGVLVDRVNQEFLFACASLCVGVSFTAFPWSLNNGMFSALQVLKGTGLGILDAGGQAYLLSHWEGRKWKDPVYQALHGLWSVGATIGPFIMRPFLIADQSTHRLDDVTVNVTIATMVDGELPIEYNVTHFTSSETVWRGFAIIGAVNFVAAVLFFLIFLIQGPFCWLKHRTSTAKKNRPKATNKEDMRYKIPLLFLLFWFYFSYLLVEDTLGTFLSTMAVRGLGWDVRMGAFLTSAYWGSHCLGRILSVPISGKLTARQMLVVSLVLTAASNVILSLLAQTYDVAVWAAASLGGLSMSCTFASGVLWASGYIWVTGIAAAVFLIGASTGVMVGEPLVAYLSQTHTYLWIAYVPCLAAIVNILLYVAMQLFAAYFPKRRFSNEKTDDETKHMDVKST